MPNRTLPATPQSAGRCRSFIRRLTRGTVFMLAASASAPLGAAPAPWHLWRSTINSRELCLQTRPGPGWEWARGPFHDSRCLKPLAYTERNFNWRNGRIDKSQRILKLPGKKRFEE